MDEIDLSQEGWGWRNGCARGGRGGDEINTTYGGPSPPHPTDCTMHKYETNTNTNINQIQICLQIKKKSQNHSHAGFSKILLLLSWSQNLPNLLLSFVVVLKRKCKNFCGLKICHNLSGDFLCQNNWRIVL